MEGTTSEARAVVRGPDARVKKKCRLGEGEAVRGGGRGDKVTSPAGPAGVAAGPGPRGAASDTFDAARTERARGKAGDRQSEA
ncbi:hypothetical protein Misp01_35100 [Microtetraspora sp. NBRC 13810]|nr:hypothetical protein Misp01_35100 [Microtetraspora sp. NBRC 13810]